MEHEKISSSSSLTSSSWRDLSLRMKEVGADGEKQEKGSKGRICTGIAKPLAIFDLGLAASWSEIDGKWIWKMAHSEVAETLVGNQGVSPDDWKELLKREGSALIKKQGLNDHSQRSIVICKEVGHVKADASQQHQSLTDDSATNYHEKISSSSSLTSSSWRDLSLRMKEVGADGEKQEKGSKGRICTGFRALI
ncbi:hypothetical protein Tco_0956526 [Tanacetum coccineum]